MIYVPLRLSLWKTSPCFIITVQKYMLLSKISVMYLVLTPFVFKYVNEFQNDSSWVRIDNPAESRQKSILCSVSEITCNGTLETSCLSSISLTPSDPVVSGSTLIYAQCKLFKAALLNIRILYRYTRRINYTCYLLLRECSFGHRYLSNPFTCYSSFVV